MNCVHQQCKHRLIGKYSSGDFIRVVKTFAFRWTVQDLEVKFAFSSEGFIIGCY